MASVQFDLMNLIKMEYDADEGSYYCRVCLKILRVYGQNNRNCEIVAHFRKVGA
jgi:hypothetical protein